MSRRLHGTIALVTGAGLSAVLFAHGSHAVFDPTAVIVGLLPLQLAALAWVWRHMPRG